ncbi:TPA: hypothetical protein PTW06_003664 [Clostridium botulinum]|nr:hypothetical protein [Clostridium botulinum]HDK7226231.1 hypothetical protein [Clostridium botulinum]HDK7273724.1 hypothetical protein [Clostridium botulinum]HDK7307072.1 hypothetical protein [Clostridium botulinum]
MDINKIAKEMTRGEFLNSEYVVIKNGKGNVISYKCPYEYGLDGYYTNCMTSCIECWKNAIKDIKFKGENCMEFNWNEFKKGEIVIHCDTKEKAINFLSECNLQNIKWVDKEYIIPTKCYFEKYETGIGYRFVPFESNEYCHGLTYDCLEFYETIGSNIIEWEIENKIDYDREYNIMEIMEFEEGTEFTLDDRYICKVKNEELRLKDGTGNWILEHLRKRIINAKFKLVKKDKKVNFSEAIQTYGKEVYCIWKDDDGIEHKSEYCIRNEWDQCIDQNCEHLAPAEIVKGEWYIKED